MKQEFVPGCLRAVAQRRIVIYVGSGAKPGGVPSFGSLEQLVLLVVESEMICRIDGCACTCDGIAIARAGFLSCIMPGEGHSKPLHLGCPGVIFENRESPPSYVRALGASVGCRMRPAIRYLYCMC